MAFLLASDLHCEFAPFDFPVFDTDKDDVLILAGDIGVVGTPSSFACVKPWIPRFKHTIMIQGNHEPYGESILRVLPKQKEIFKDQIATGKLSVVNNEVIRVDNVSYICATLWTNYYGGNPIIMQTVRGALNDYKYIRTGNYGDPYLRRINPHDLLNEHIISKDFIFTNIEKEKAAGQKTVVVTHHGCSTKSIHAQYQGDPVNWGYVSDLELRIVDAQPDIMVHGHTHHSFDYMIGNTRVVVNPRGYAREIHRLGKPTGEYVNENEEFNPTLRIEI